MEKQLFDKAIKKSLESLKVDYNAAHWEQMETLLNHLPIGDETDRDAHFDYLIKNKLSTITPPAIAPSWATMETALSAAETTDVNFDKTIQEKIGHLEGNSPNWANIEEALDAEAASDAQFDEEIYAKLRGLQTNYQPSHWHRLVTKMNANFALKEKLYQYKLLEVTVMILLLLNFYHYMPSNYSVSTDIRIAQKSTTLPIIEAIPKTVIFEESIEENLKSVAPISSTNTSAEKSTTEANKSETVIKPIIEQSTTISDKNNEIVADNSDATNTNNTIDNTSNLSIVVIKRNKIFIQKIQKLTPTMEQRSSLSISMSEMNRHLALHTNTGNNLISTIPSLQPNFVESQYITPLGCKDCKNSKIPARLRLGLISNIALNNAYRAGGQILDIGALNQKGFGYGSGFSLGFKYGRWEIETGLAYAAKQYDPNIIEKHGGIVSNGGISQTHFQTIHLQTAHIPINLRYNYAVLGKGRWHLYTQAGASLNVILRAEYDLAETTDQGRFQGVATTTSRLSLIDYNNGLLAGDGLKENKYLAISMGAGVERYISPHWSIFVQPDFHFHFSGNRIGPIEDRINTLSLSFGARKSLY